MPKPPKVLDQHFAALAAATAFADVFEPLRDDPAVGEVEALAEVVAKLDVPTRPLPYASPEEERLELVRTLAVHGDGLRAFGESVPCAVGDVLVDDARSVWLVTTVDEEGRVMEVAGGALAPASRRQRRFVLTWRPRSTARMWLEPRQTPAPAYGDLAKTLTHVVRLWGETHNEGRDLTSPVGFFVEVADAPGLKVLRSALTEYSDPHEVASFCEARGGLAAIGPRTALTPGDIVRTRKGKAWALVTRAQHKPTAIDVVVGGQRARGELGEPAAAVKMLCGADREQFDVVWRPASKASARGGASGRGR